MKASWICILLACLLRASHAVNLVVIRDEDDSASKSVEEEEESAAEISEESRDIDMLVDLIEKATHQRNKPQLRTVRVMRHRKEPASQHTTRKETISKPSPKEIHVHYHTHQHPGEGDLVERVSLKPLHWESLSSHLNTFKDVYKPPRSSPFMSLSAVERFKQFKDFEDLIQKPANNGGKIWNGSEFPDHFDDAVVQQHPPSKSEKSSNDLNLERLRRYQALLKARFKPRTTEQEDFPNRERFAGFTDFSTLESAQPTSPKEQEQKKDTKEDLEIRDFAIVIKTKPKAENKAKDVGTKDAHQYRKRYRSSGDADRGRSISVPRILDAPGGAPQFIERLHQGRQVKAGKNNLNSIESQQRQTFLRRPGFRQGFGNHVYNGWMIQRWLR